MKVLLANPFVERMHQELAYAENFRPPLGLAYCAALLERAGHAVEIHDALLLGTRPDAFARMLRRAKPDVVGLSIYSPTRYESFRTAQLVRDTLGPSVPIVAGGPHVSAVPEDTLAHVEAIDHVVAGEGDEALLELCEVLARGGDASAVPGVWTRRGEGVVSGPVRPNIPDLDALPKPARHLLPMTRYGTRMPSTMRAATTLLTSRGCPARCTFCTRDWFSRETRLHSPEYIVDELEEVIGRWGFRGVIFQDDTFTLNKKRIARLCDLIEERKLRFEWLATTRVDCLTLDLLKRMRSAGCRVVTFGAESMNPETLRWLHKGFTVEQVRRAVDWANEAGVTVRCSYLMGIGDETEEDLRRSIREARALKVSKLKANVGLSIYPGTPLHPMAVAAGVLPADYSFAEGWRDERRRYGNGETPRWYTPHVPLERLLELRRETEVNVLFTRPSLDLVRHRARKFAKRLVRHPGETVRHVAQFARAALGGSSLRSDDASPRVGP
ncbi:MAG: B12-binding domain-containing radical SAM protein [Planctomycetes bacterium]|nr:B12-binding domain-containing radical SAM protein [Planctomycetota bacterium]